MRIAARHVVLLAILGLLIGHASLAVHAASHPLADAVDCALCISYSSASQTVSTPPEQAVTWLSANVAPCDADVEASTTVAIHYDQRGPPARH